MTEVYPVWHTPNGEDLIAKMARVSNPANEDNKETAPKLIRYLIKNQHWSPFEMVNMCVGIRTTRDIGRQLLRHWTIRPQEFSQRYAQVLEEPIYREARLQDTKDRQNSIELGHSESDAALDNDWNLAQKAVWEEAESAYLWALDKGIAKEVARAVLPEGMTSTHMYFNGNIRSWIHFCQLRTGNGTQKECREVAEGCLSLLYGHFPTIAKAVFEDEV